MFSISEVPTNFWENWLRYLWISFFFSYSVGIHHLFTICKTACTHAKVASVVSDSVQPYGL